MHLSIKLLISLHLKSHSFNCVSSKNTGTEKNTNNNNINKLYNL